MLHMYFVILAQKAIYGKQLGSDQAFLYALLSSPQILPTDFHAVWSPSFQQYSTRY